MAWRYHGRAKVDSNSPSAFGVCDRCKMLYNLRDLHWQYDWRGPRLMNLRLLVCDKDLDKPQEQLRPRVIPPDPLPIPNARPENFAAEMGPPPAPWSPTEYFQE